MASGDLLEEKQIEISQLAKRMGVERYINTQRFAEIKNMMQVWAETSQNENSLSRESTWLDVKSEIEGIIANMSLENNSSSELYLLGQTGGTGEVSYDEVRQAFANGFNTLMEQYSFVISEMGQYQVGKINRKKDKALTSIPLFGDMAGKNQAAQILAQALTEIEECIIGYQAEAQRKTARRVIAEKETARSIMLAQAESNTTEGLLSQAEYDEILSLIGRRNSLFEQQLDSVKTFGGDLSSIFAQMDKSIAAASAVLQQMPVSNGLSGFVTSGSQINTSKARMTEMGDGFRTNDWRLRGSNVKIVGQGVPMESSTDPRGYPLIPGPSGYPWIGSLQSQLNPPVQTGMLPLAWMNRLDFLPSSKLRDPRYQNQVSNTYWSFSGTQNVGQLSNQQKRTANNIAKNKMAGIEKNGFGATIKISDEKSIKTPGYIDALAVAGLIYAGTKIYGAYTQQKTLRLSELLKFGVHPKQIKNKKAVASIDRKQQSLTAKITSAQLPGSPTVSA